MYQVGIRDFVWIPGSRHADNFAPNKLHPLAFGLRQLHELWDRYQHRGCTHVLIVLSVLTTTFGGGQFFDLHQFGGVIAGITGVAVFAFRIVYGFSQGIEREIRERIGFDDTGEFLRWSDWRRSVRSRTACRRRRSTVKSWAGRRCADALRGRPHCAPCGRSCGWWSRARWNHPPGSRACLPDDGARDSTSASRRNRESPAMVR